MPGVEVVIYPASLFHCETEVVAKLFTVSPVEVVIYPELFVHWLMFADAKFPTTSPVDVVM